MARENSDLQVPAQLARQDQGCCEHCGSSEVSSGNKDGEEEIHKFKAFRPFAHRTSSLLILFTITLALVGLIEFGFHKLSQTSANASLVQRRTVQITPDELLEHNKEHGAGKLDSQQPLGSILRGTSSETGNMSSVYAASYSSAVASSHSGLPVLQSGKRVREVTSIDYTTRTGPQSVVTTLSSQSHVYFTMQRQSYMQTTQTTIYLQSSNPQSRFYTSNPAIPDGTAVSADYMKPSIDTSVYATSTASSDYMRPSEHTSFYITSVEPFDPHLTLNSIAYLNPEATTTVVLSSGLDHAITAGSTVSSAMGRILEDGDQGFAPTTRQRSPQTEYTVTATNGIEEMIIFDADQGFAPTTVEASLRSKYTVTATNGIVEMAILDSSGTPITVPLSTAYFSAPSFSNEPANFSPLPTAAASLSQYDSGSEAESPQVETALSNFVSVPPTTPSQVVLTPTIPPNMLNSTVPLTFVATPGNYFLVVYFPVLVAGLLRQMASYLYRCTKLMDPFYMLTQHGGVAASEFLSAAYIGNESMFAPIQALRSRRWLLFGVSLIYAATQLITILAAELISIHSSNYTFRIQDGFELTQGQALWLNPAIGRTIQVILSLIAAMLFAVWLMFRKYTTGVETNPATIGTLACILSHPCVVHDLMEIRQEDGGIGSNARLSNRRYILGYYTTRDNLKVRSLIPVRNGDKTTTGCPSFVLAPGLNSPGTASSSSSFTSKPIKTSRTLKRFIPYALLRLILFTCTCITLFGVILSYTLNANANPFEHFMDSQSFGPRVLLIILSLLLKSSLLTLSAKATVAIPFRRLTQRPRYAHHDLLSPIPVTPLGAIFYSLRRLEWFSASLAVAGGFIVELMVILVPGVPFYKYQIWASAATSWYGCIACLCFFLLVIVAAWIKALSREDPEYSWPKSPEQMGVVLKYLAGTEMAKIFSVEYATASLQVNNTKIYAGDSVEQRWVAENIKSKALYDFGPREDGRWLIELADKADEESSIAHR